MRKIMISLLVFALVFSIGFLSNATSAYAGWVSGYYKSNGTYVNSYYRSTPSYKSYTPSYKSYTPSYKSYTPSYKSYTPSYKSYTPSYKSYTPLYKSYRNYPSYKSGLKYQKGYYKPSTGSWISGHLKTYSDGYKWNNRKSLYGW